MHQNDFFDLLHDKLGELLNEYFPKVRIKINIITGNHGFPIACDCLSKRKIDYIIVIRRYILLKTKLIIKILISTAETTEQQKSNTAKNYWLDIKKNMNKSWGIVKNIINKNKSLIYQTKFKLRDGTVTTDKTVISKYFNEFFLDVGPILAKAIPKLNIDPKSYLGKSMKKHFLGNLLL